MGQKIQDIYHIPFLRLLQEFHMAYDPKGLRLRHAFKSSFAVLLAILGAHYFQLEQPFWIVLPTAFIMQTQLKVKSNRQRFAVITISALAAIFFVFIGSIIGKNTRC